MFGINERDWDGSMDIFQNQILEVGVTKDMFDFDMYAGLTYGELQNLANQIIAIRKNRKEEQ